ncbi:MAG: nuclear transport factor 2 family protein [Kordiimonas sp.]
MTKTQPQNDFQVITNMVQAYFDGLHHGDTKKLRPLFHVDTVLKAPGIRRTREEWLELVDSRPVPQKEGHPYAYKILSIDVVGDQAMVKALCPLLGSIFIDYLGLLKENGQWLFVSKMYADS